MRLLEHLQSTNLLQGFKDASLGKCTQAALPSGSTTSSLQHQNKADVHCLACSCTCDSETCAARLQSRQPLFPGQRSAASAAWAMPQCTPRTRSSVETLDTGHRVRTCDVRTPAAPRLPHQPVPLAPRSAALAACLAAADICVPAQVPLAMGNSVSTCDAEPRAAHQLLHRPLPLGPRSAASAFRPSAAMHLHCSANASGFYRAKGLYLRCRDSGGASAVSSASPSGPTLSSVGSLPKSQDVALEGCSVGTCASWSPDGSRKLELSARAS